MESYLGLDLLSYGKMCVLLCPAYLYLMLHVQFLKFVILCLCLRNDVNSCEVCFISKCCIVLRVLICVNMKSVGINCVILYLDCFFLFLYDVIIILLILLQIICRFLNHFTNCCNIFTIQRFSFQIRAYFVIL